ncbi:Major viral transcription factor [Actinidia chinensis var. chinensis]|uniref:Major viral transcription factor n=1 Tax=Actinidia chinensis var. chinensis TaxID=1590841 RepID=A0A2R6QGM9_ACTCC|nr:Major viral transcription factor [Actinidia chinensis var. chinensis]
MSGVQDISVEKSYSYIICLHKDDYDGLPDIALAVGLVVGEERVEESKPRERKVEEEKWVEDGDIYAGGLRVIGLRRYAMGERLEKGNSSFGVGGDLLKNNIVQRADRSVGPYPRNGDYLTPCGVEVEVGKGCRLITGTQAVKIRIMGWRYLEWKLNSVNGLRISLRGADKQLRSSRDLRNLVCTNNDDGRVKWDDFDGCSGFGSKS